MYVDWCCVCHKNTRCVCMYYVFNFWDLVLERKLTPFHDAYSFCFTISVCVFVANIEKVSRTFWYAWHSTHYLNSVSWRKSAPLCVYWFKSSDLIFVRNLSPYLVFSFASQCFYKLYLAVIIFYYIWIAPLM